MKELPKTTQLGKSWAKFPVNSRVIPNLKGFSHHTVSCGMTSSSFEPEVENSVTYGGGR